ncbi:MAG: hypothetical protein EZS28_010711 [Streblomastix strix]|uniref:SPRY domain-containing protein n=1 Tax=Streblomastix strix TaxID=222440 RepID=A0A5J4WFU3_9EUKA|nr:MAG: hypothetical protein EZS28_010711 [Streblomastix strix]
MFVNNLGLLTGPYCLADSLQNKWLSSKYVKTFDEMRRIVDDFNKAGGEAVKQLELIQQLLPYMENYPDFFNQLNEIAPLRDTLKKIQEYYSHPELKDHIEKTLVLLDTSFIYKEISPHQYESVSFLDHFRPILLVPEYQHYISGTRTVKMIHIGQVTVPFDPVFTVFGAPIRPILLDKAFNKIVKKELSVAQSTFNGGIIFCDMVFFNGQVHQDNAVPIRIGILDADIPLVNTSKFVAGKNKGGITFDSDGSIWLNGSWDDSTDQSDKWKRETHIGMEIDLSSNPRTLRFFVGGRQINRYVTNIPARVRFFATTILIGDYFSVNQLSLCKHSFGQLRSTDVELIAEDSLFDYSAGL